jgi:hypothetical protein
MQSHRLIQRELVTGILALVLSAGLAGLPHGSGSLAASSHPVALATIHTPLNPLVPLCRWAYTYCMCRAHGTLRCGRMQHIR